MRASSWASISRASTSAMFWGRRLASFSSMRMISASIFSGMGSVSRSLIRSGCSSTCMASVSTAALPCKGTSPTSIS